MHSHVSLYTPGIERRSKAAACGVFEVSGKGISGNEILFCNPDYAMDLHVLQLHVVAPSTRTNQRNSCVLAKQTDSWLYCDKQEQRQQVANLPLIGFVVNLWKPQPYFSQYDLRSTCILQQYFTNSSFSRNTTNQLGKYFSQTQSVFVNSTCLLAYEQMPYLDKMRSKKSIYRFKKRKTIKQR